MPEDNPAVGIGGGTEGLHVESQVIPPEFFKQAAPEQPFSDRIGDYILIDDFSNI